MLSVAVLLARFGSGVAPETVAVLTTVPVCDDGIATVTTICVAADPGARSVALAHVTVPEPGVHTQPTPAALTNEEPAGSVSTTRMGARETDGPRFVTSRVYVASWPATTAPECVFARARSAAVVTVAVSVSVLFGSSGSYVRAVTSAVFDRTVPDAVSAGTDTVTVMTGNDAPEASDPGAVVRTQVRSAPMVEQLQPVPVAETNVVGASIVSVTVNGPTAVSGPALDTVRLQRKAAPATGAPVCDLTMRTSAESMRVDAVAGLSPYGPTLLPNSSVASRPKELAVLVCGTEAPTPGVVTTPGCGVAR